ncbi:MAG: endoribonuclease MazF [Sphingobacteriia bacterium]|nr:endoribonuclease MazF [Sphingobacteriia bacterium]
MEYVPDKGDIIWIDFDPQAGSEQAKRRPAIVLTPKIYNKKTSLCIICPITSKIKNYPFEVKVKINNSASAILADHVKSFDWKARNAEFLQKAPKGVKQQVLEKLSLLLS